MPILFEGKGWKKKPGWYSEVWNLLNNIYNLMGNQTEVQNLLTSLSSMVIPKATRLVVYTVKMLEADKEYSQKLPEHTKGFTIQTTDGTAFRLSPEPRRVAKAKRPYWSVPTNSPHDEGNLDLSSTTLYFASSTSDKTIEIFVKI